MNSLFGEKGIINNTYSIVESRLCSGKTVLFLIYLEIGMREAIVTDLDAPDPVASMVRVTNDDYRGSLEPIASALVADQQDGLSRPLPPPIKDNLVMSSRSLNYHAISDNSHNHSDHTLGATCGFCRTNLKLGDKGFIESRNFPDPYPDNESCLWLLMTADGSNIRLTCDTIQVCFNK